MEAIPAAYDDDVGGMFDVLHGARAPAAHSAPTFARRQRSGRGGVASWVGRILHFAMAETSQEERSSETFSFTAGAPPGRELSSSSPVCGSSTTSFKTHPQKECASSTYPGEELEERFLMDVD